MRLHQNEILAATAVAMYIVFFGMYPPEWVRNVLANPVGMAALFGGSVYVAIYKSKLVGGLLIAAFVLSMTRVTENLTVGGITIADGQSYGCTESGEYGMVMGGQLRGYANPTVASSYDPQWSSARKITCAGAPRGDGLTTNKPASGGGTTSAARSYQSYANTDYTLEGDLGMVTGDVASCQRQCDARDGCTGFAQAGSSCYLKNASVRTARYVPGVNHYYTGTPPPGGPARAPATTTGSGATGGGTTPPITTPTAPASSTPAVTPPAAPPATATVPVRPVMSCNLENFASF